MTPIQWKAFQNFKYIKTDFPEARNFEHAVKKNLRKNFRYPVKG